MKVFSVIVKASTIVGVILLVNFNPGCRDPHDFEPPEDSLVPPPAPPQHLAPAESTVFMVEGFPHTIHFEWSELVDANYYELEITVASFPPAIVPLDSTSWTLYIRDTHRLHDHTWRVHASSPRWTWFTDWSEPWHFDVRFRPPGPELISPPQASTVYLDSLPNAVYLYWHPRSDETFYEVMVYKDTTLVYQDIVYDTIYWAYVDDTVQYLWQVRASSPKWEKYSYWSALWNFWVALY